MNLLSVPNEVFRVIMEFAGLKTTCRLAATCKNIRSVVNMKEIQKGVKNEVITFYTYPGDSDLMKQVRWSDACFDHLSKFNKKNYMSMNESHELRLKMLEFIKKSRSSAFLSELVRPITREEAYEELLWYHIRFNFDCLDYKSTMGRKNFMKPLLLRDRDSKYDAVIPSFFN